VIAAVVTLLVALAAGGGWWFGQGPGSTIPVPEVAGLDLATAEQTLKDATLVAEPFECSSLEVEAGLAARTEPKAGTRVDRGSTVRLCQSTGPELLAVPALVGLSVEDAKREIETARFTFGSVIEQQFDGGTKGTVILAVDTNGEGLGETYPEQAVIDLIVSAGSVPQVAGLSVEDATKALTDAGLTVDSSLNSEAHYDEIEQGKVISAVLPEDTLRVGSTVGLSISLGPELVEIPDVKDMPLQEAMDLLASLGFDATTNVPDSLRTFAIASGTSPKSGEKAKKGSTVQVKAKIDL